MEEPNLSLGQQHSAGLTERYHPLETQNKLKQGSAMFAARSSSHLNCGRKVHNTSSEAFSAASASATKGTSVSPATSASLTRYNPNAGRTTRSDVDRSFSSVDPNDPLARSRVGLKNDYKATALEQCQHQQQRTPEASHLEVPSYAPSKVMDKFDQDGQEDRLEATTPSARDATVQRPAPATVDPSPIPKWIRVGEKVCFSTVVSAVLIPSAEDISASSKRELWWQPEDFFEFRMNHARRQAAGKSADDEEEEEYSARPPVVTATASSTSARRASFEADSGPVEVGTTVTAVTTKYNNNNTTNTTSDATATATVEGVLIVAATPACSPTVIASRSASSSVLSVDAEGQIGGYDSRAGEQKKKVKAPNAAGKERPSKWAASRAKNPRPDNLNGPRRVTENRGKGAMTGANHGSNKRHGRGNRPPSSRSTSGRRTCDRSQYPSYGNHVAQRSFDSSHPHGARYGSITASNVYVPPPELGRRPMYDMYETGSNPVVTGPVFMGQYSRQQPMGGARGSMIPGPLHPDMMMIHAQDMKSQFSMWRSPVFAPVMMQCARGNVVM